MESQTNSVNADSFSIEGSDDLLLSVILDQASDIVDGWREAISNGIDSASSENIWLWKNQVRSIIHDDGNGMTLTEGKGQELLTTMGESDKDRDSNDTIGQFGIGKGQYIAKGQVSILSNGKALHFDIKSWGIKNGVYRTTIDDAIDFIKPHSEEWAECLTEGLEKHNNEGLTVIVNHYDSETPDYDWKWTEYDDKIRNRFKYVGLVNDKNIYINDEKITRDDIDIDELPTKCVKRHIDLGVNGEVHIGIGHKSNGSVEVYSNGVYVKDLQLRGFDGVVVTSNNLKLNFARNDIQSGCEVWDVVQDHLTNVQLEVCKKVNDAELNASAREFVVNQMYESDAVYSDWKEAELFKSASESMYSISEIESEDSISFAQTGDDLADRVEEGLKKVVLAEDDSAVSILRQNESYTEEHIDDIASENNLQRSKEELDFEELTPRQRNKLGVARLLSQRLGINRDIRWGESEVSNAWTDGYSYIVITDSGAPSSSWMQWVPELYRIIIHEWSHNTSTLDNHPSHGNRFAKAFRSRIDENWYVLSQLIEEINDNGIRSYRAEY